MPTREHDSPETLVQTESWFTRRRKQLVIGSLGVVLLVPLFISLVLLIPYLRERRIASQVESVGGTVAYDYFGPEWLTQSLREQIPLFDRITMVELSRTKNTDRALTDLWLLSKLDRLDLERSEVTDEGLTSIGRLSHLRGLGLNQTRITDAGLAHLIHLTKLEGLHLDGTATTDDGLKYLQGMQQLQLLKLSNTKVSDTGVETLIGLRELRLLNQAGSRVTHRGYLSLRRALPDCELPLIFNIEMMRQEF